MNPIILQTGYYMIVLILGFLMVNLLQKGFFAPYMGVKASFGKCILVKVRAVNRDYFKKGIIDDGFLVFSGKTGQKRLNIKDSSYFYRALGISWIDVDEEKNSITKPDHTGVSGFDAVKYNNLYTRALYRPGIKDNMTKAIIGCLVLVIILILALGFVLYKQSYSLEIMAQQIASVKSGVIVGV